MSCARCEHDRLADNPSPADIREHELRRVMCERFGKYHGVTKRQDVERMLAFHRRRHQAR